MTRIERSTRTYSRLGNDFRYSIVFTWQPLHTNDGGNEKFKVFTADKFVK